MLRRQERDFLDDVTLREAEDALGVPVVTVESDGFALWDALCGVIEESSPSPAPSEDTEYYPYNQNRREN